VKLSPTGKLVVVGNESYGTGADGEPVTDAVSFRERPAEADVAKLSQALDDLRRMGELDLRLNHPASGTK
jgi:hypothetical protein